MAKIVYRIVKHEDGWAYKVRGTFSETFRAMMRLSPRQGWPPASRGFRERRSASNTRPPTACGTKRSIRAPTGRRPLSRTTNRRVGFGAGSAQRREMGGQRLSPLPARSDGEGASLRSYAASTRTISVSSSALTASSASSVMAAPSRGADADAVDLDAALGRNEIAVPSRRRAHIRRSRRPSAWRRARGPRP